MELAYKPDANIFGRIIDLCHLRQLLLFLFLAVTLLIYANGIYPYRHVFERLSKICHGGIEIASNMKFLGLRSNQGEDKVCQAYSLVGGTWRRSVKIANVDAAVRLLSAPAVGKRFINVL